MYYVYIYAHIYIFAYIRPSYVCTCTHSAETVAHPLDLYIDLDQCLVQVRMSCTHIYVPTHTVNPTPLCLIQKCVYIYRYI